MAKKKQNYWYVLVLESDGPAFVTAVNYSERVAYWNKSDKPLELSQNEAKELALMLSVNFHMAFTVCNRFELTEQPYRYDLGRFKWEKAEKED